MKAIAAQKQHLRQLALKRRSGLSARYRAQASGRACDFFLQQIPVSHGARLALFFPIGDPLGDPLGNSLGDEIDCRLLIPELLNRDCQLCLPVVTGPGQPLIFRVWDGKSELEPAPFGTSVPGESAREVVPEIVVLPLAGFDNRGNRLGYGKGFYDRTIAAMAEKPLLAGLAFGVQELENIPVLPHDVPLDAIVTENGVRVFKPEGKIS